MTIETIVSLVIALLIFAIVPGPGNFAVVARALSGGFGAGVAMSAGIALGDLLYVTAALAGLAAIGPMLGSAFIAVKFISAAYLIWLGIHLWRQTPQVYEANAKRKQKGFTGNAAAGFLITLGNPKVFIFYLVFLPVFVGLDRLSAGDAVVVAIIVPITVSLPLLGYSLLAARARRFCRRPGAPRALNRTAGTFLIGAGITIAVRQ